MPLIKTKSAFQDYLELCKPRVVALMLLTVVVGMYMATPGWVDLKLLCFALIGIAFSASSAAVINHLVDKHIDLLMLRTSKRPVATGRISVKKALYFAITLGVLGLGILFILVNTLTAILTFSTLIGYAALYTGYLKRATSQNIVIGGLAGAAPPLLGWTAITNQVSAEPLILVLIIFTWTPPHFWALAIYRFEEYKNANLPMLPITHGIKYTKLSIILYTILLIVVSILPYLIGMSSALYAIAAVFLGILFLYLTIKLYFSEDKILAFQTFRFSVVYLLALFIFLLVDHFFFLG